MQNPIQTISRFRNFFNVIFSKYHFFSRFRSLYCKGEKHEFRKNHFSVLFDIMRSPFQTFLRFQNFFNFFFQKFNFFTVSTPILERWETWGQRKSHFLVLFYSAKSNSDHFTISELFQCFFSKYQFFSRFRSLYCKGEKHEFRKNQFSVLFFIVQNPFQTILRFQNIFNVFFSKYQLFSRFWSLYCKGEKHEVRKKSFLVLFYSAKSNSDRVKISDFSSFFSKI